MLLKILEVLYFADNFGMKKWKSTGPTRELIFTSILCPRFFYHLETSKLLLAPQVVCLKQNYFCETVYLVPRKYLNMNCLYDPSFDFISMLFNRRTLN